MKKFCSLFLTACMLVALMLPMTGCGLFKKKIDKGTEAAKLLLANERMDENLFGSSIDIGLSGGSVKSAALDKSLSSNSRPTVKNLSSVGRYPASLINSGSGHTWKDFPAASASLIEFNQFMNSVDYEVKRVAEDITEMKQKVAITDRWVDVDGYKQMLRVFENYDCLLIDDSDNGSIYVYYRYTDESARNYYEMYSILVYDDGTTCNIRTLYVPGERYEYMCEQSRGFVDYFIAEKTRGYWVNTRFHTNTNQEDGGKNASFFTYIVKDGLGYGFAKSYVANAEGEHHDTSFYYVFDPNTDRELFRVTSKEDHYRFELYFSAIRSGFVSVSADELSESIEPGVFETNRLNTITTSKGVYTAQNDIGKEFAFETGYVQYFYGENIYYGSIAFVVNGQSWSIDEACMNFGDYATSIGLELYCDMETVALSLEHAKLMDENFEESFHWNGYTLRDISQVFAALDVLREDYAAARSDYEAVKNFETVNSRQRLSQNVHFAKLDIAANGDNRMEGNTVRIGGITVYTEDVELFEEGVRYVIKVGLALVDSEGNPISVNTVALEGDTPVAVGFEGDSITLSATGEYVIPKNLLSGSYATVVYVATADEGIRVSEMHKIAFVDIREGEIESAAMLVKATNVDSHLIVSYEIKNTRTVTVRATKEEYAYTEVERVILAEILSYGAPMHGAVLETQSGESISPDATVGRGVYRMMCYLNSADGLAQGYVFLTIE